MCAALSSLCPAAGAAGAAVLRAVLACLIAAPRRCWPCALGLASLSCPRMLFFAEDPGQERKEVCA